MEDDYSAVDYGQDIVIYDYEGGEDFVEVSVDQAVEKQPSLSIHADATLSPDDAFDLMNNIRSWLARVGEEGKWWG